MRSEPSYPPAPGAGSACLKPAASSPAKRELTRNERVVLETLQAAATPLKAYQLLETLRDEGVRAPMTIYRALGALIDRGLAKKITSLNAYTAAEGRAVAFIICRHCGRTEERRLSSEQINNLFAPNSMPVEDVFIEAYGVCGRKSCQQR